MFPDIETAIRELEIAGQMNPGSWVKHSYNVANAARIIAEHCKCIDHNKAYVCGLLHDIGRRTGISALRHTIDGYDYAVSQGWDEIARVCITHSFPVQDIEAEKKISVKRNMILLMIICAILNMMIMIS